MTERGRLRNPNLALVERDFAGIRIGACTMTDIDGFMELGGRMFIFVESKFGGAPLPFGQKLALERLVDSIHCTREKRYATAIIVDQFERTELVDYAQLPVRCFRWCRSWEVPPIPITLNEKVHFFHRLSLKHRLIAETLQESNHERSRYR